MRRKNRTTPEAPHPLEDFIVALIVQGFAYPDIEKALLEKGLTQPQAETLVATTLNRQVEQQSAGNKQMRQRITRGAGLFNMLSGIGICIVAGVVAVISFAASRGDIGVTLLVSPAIVYGLFRFITGLWQLFER